MRVVIQRVSEASVHIQNGKHAEIGKGLLVLLGIEESDSEDDIAWICGKITRLRIFNDADGIMNLAINEVGGKILIVSQFTLYASTKKGNRPSYIRAAGPEIAIPVYNKFIRDLVAQTKVPVSTGVFGAEMEVKLINNGPVTIIIDSKNRE
jgi:D-tyrosyl-tRNA(Tyr) deacylase